LARFDFDDFFEVFDTELLVVELLVDEVDNDDDDVRISL
jgi:hypothetical protein